MEYGGHISMDYRRESCTVAGRRETGNHNLIKCPGSCFPTPAAGFLAPEELSVCKLPVSAILNRLHPAYNARQPSPSRETTWLARPFEPSGYGRDFQLAPHLGEGIAAARTLPAGSPAFGQPWRHHRSQCRYTNKILASRYCGRANDRST